MGTHFIPTFDSSGALEQHVLSHASLTGQWQSPYEQSLIQNFPIGTRLQLHDRTFYYCLAAGTTAVAMKAGHNSILGADVNTYAEAYAAGYTGKIRIEDTDTRAAHYYQNGYAWVMNSTSGVFQMLKIKDSDVAAASDDHVHITLYDPLPFAIPASTFVSARPNPFSAITFTDSAYQAMVCVPLIPVTTAYYFWGQTWGPCFGTAMSAIPGAASADREVYFNGDGALIAGADTVLETRVPQRAGFVLSPTSTGGDQFYMLQITP